MKAVGVTYIITKTLRHLQESISRNPRARLLLRGAGQVELLPQHDPGNSGRPSETPEPTTC